MLSQRKVYRFSDYDNDYDNDNDCVKLDLSERYVYDHPASEHPGGG